MSVTSDQLKQLKDEINHKWRVQSFSKYKATCICVAYIDARQVMDRLDNICGPENWQRIHEESIQTMGFCKIGINIETESGSEWVWKSDVGEKSNMSEDKGLASDSFKRSAVNWGIGRSLYEEDIVILPTNKSKSDCQKGENPYPVYIDKSGNQKRIWNLTSYINNNGRKGIESENLTNEINKQIESLESQIKNQDKMIEIKSEHFGGTTKEYIDNADEDLVKRYINWLNQMIEAGK